MEDGSRTAVLLREPAWVSVRSGLSRQRREELSEIVSNKVPQFPIFLGLNQFAACLRLSLPFACGALRQLELGNDLGDA